MNKKKIKKILRKVWWFIWEDDSIWSWLVNIVLAFILIKFIVYPGLGLILSTSHPIVAVVSDSMEHNMNFEEWWDKSKNWYIEKDITKEKFMGFPLKNGFYKGDIMILIGKKSEALNVGDVIVFISHRENPKPDPIIHRVIKKWEENDKYYFKTKGDKNQDSINSCDKDGYCIDETDIREEQVIGKALFRVPLLGYIKIIFVEILKLIGLIK